MWKRDCWQSRSGQDVEKKVSNRGEAEFSLRNVHKLVHNLQAKAVISLRLPWHEFQPEEVFSRLFLTVDCALTRAIIAHFPLSFRETYRVCSAILSPRIWIERCFIFDLSILRGRSSTGREIVRKTMDDRRGEKWPWGNFEQFNDVTDIGMWSFFSKESCRTNVKTIERIKKHLIKK